MGKKYNVRLWLKEGDSKNLKALSQVYRKAYNKGVEVQFNYLTHEQELIPAEKVTLLIGDYKFSSSKIDLGIIEAGIRDSVKYFHEWWNTRLESSSLNHSIPMTPSHLHARNGIFFKTTTNLKVSSKGFIYLPKFGEIKIKELHRVPSGAYKNAKFIFDGVVWDAFLESVIEEEPVKIAFLRDSLTVTVLEDGSVIIDDTVFTSPLEFDWYEKISKEIKRAEKNVKKSNPNSKELVAAKDYLSHLNKRAMRQVLAYYKTIVNRILTSKPRSLKIEGAPLFEHASEIARASKVKILLQVLKAKAERLGIKVTIKGIDNSMFVVKN